MNALQIARKARLSVDAIRANNAISDLWSDEEVEDALNTAMDAAARILRLSGSRLLTKTLTSLDPPSEFVEEFYDPASLRLVANQREYQLPPDFVHMVNLLPITTGFEGVRFRPFMDTHKTWVDERLLTAEFTASATNSDTVYHYTLLGGRTLRIVPAPHDTIDVELLYSYRPPRLQTYTTGTITTTANSVVVTGTDTLWRNIGIRTPAEFLSAVTGDTVLLNVHYPTVASIDNDTQLSLTKEWDIAPVTNGAYSLSMVPTLPQEHHNWLGQMTAALMLRKINIELSDNAKKALELELEQYIKPEIENRQFQESIAVEPYELP